ncbi:TetR/AcrR family transcriptional regulator [Brucella anthropi]|uniref:TetR/AcrR family transcriptional regulator n=1 Tax=Brucella anthropi TaxID=529 RepID=UPI003EE3B3EA
MPRQPLTDDEINHTRRRILREAAMIVGKGGIAGLSMRTLAQRLGLTPGALYRYFPRSRRCFSVTGKMRYRRSPTEQGRSTGTSRTRHRQL